MSQTNPLRHARAPEVEAALLVEAEESRDDRNEIAAMWQPVQDEAYAMYCKLE